MKTAQKHSFSTKGQLLVDLAVFFSGLLIVYFFFVSGAGMPPFSRLSIPWIAIIPAISITAMSMVGFLIDEARLGYASHIIAVATYQMLIFGELFPYNYSLSIIVVSLLFIASNLNRTLVYIEAAIVVAMSLMSLFISYPSATTRHSVGLVAILTILATIFSALFSKYFTGRKISTGEHIILDNELETDVILESVSDGIIIINADGTITGFNPAASSITKWPIADALGINYRFILKIVDSKGQALEAQKDPFTLAASQGTYDSRELSIVDSQNSMLPVAINVGTISSGGKVSYLVVLHDASKETEDIRKKSDFISTASHEMRTPIASIEGYLALAMNPKVAGLDAKGQELVTKAYQSTRHLGQLFKDLLETTQATDGRLKFNPQVTNINDLLLNLYDQMRILAAEKQLNVAMYVGRTPLVRGAVMPQYQANVDPVRISEAIMNIFDNAVKYTQTGGIAIILNADDSNLIISIKDTGIGIPQADIPHMFQKFYRVDNSATRAIGGTGLGLFLSKSIVTQSGGSIWVDSIEGKGSTFHIRLQRLNNLTTASRL